MNKILLCTQNPMLIKGLYGPLRDEGYIVVLSDFPAHAVQLILRDSYESVIIDAHAFGMPAEEAMNVMKTVAPAVRVIIAGASDGGPLKQEATGPIDLEWLRSRVRSNYAAA